MQVSYHNHTAWSDGTALLSAMLDGARAAGLDEFGLSDHFALMPGSEPVSWAMPPDFLDEYVRALWETAAATDDLVFRVGIEVDYFPQTEAETLAALANHRFDYLIGSVHFADGFPIDASPGPWEALTVDERDDVWRRYWTYLRRAVETRAFDFIGHLDLPKKFGFLPRADFSGLITDLLDAIADCGPAIELNTAGWDKPIGEQYPSLTLLRETRHRGIPLVISADGHAPGHVANHFPRAVALAREAGYTEILRFANRERFAVPL
ncbi:MAG: Histidinol-phosphatase [bacterium ADurb.Bin429]|nr:MAG: Histidinol-phosphatase [bacterium ADurb.Bin429]